MSRYEEENQDNSTGELQSEVEKIKKQLRRKQNRKVFGCGSCLLVILILIGLTVLGTLYVLAKTGLKDVPYLSNMVYQEPTPSYLVLTDKLTPADTDFLAILKKATLAEQMKQKTTENLQVKIQLTEAQLTALFRQALLANEDINKKIQYTQVAVKNDVLEVFIKTEDDLVFVLTAKPEIKDKRIVLSAEDFRLGNLSLPGFMKNFTVGIILENTANKALDLFSAVGDVQTISVQQGAVTATLLIKNLQELIKYAI